MYETDSITKVHEFVAHSTEINCLSFGPKSHQVVATGGNDFKVNVWKVGNASNIWTLGQNKSPVECLCFDAEEQYVVSGAMNGSIKVFDLNEGKLARNLSGHQVNTCSIQYHPYGEFIVSGSVDCSMKVWDVRNKTCIQTYSGHKKEVTCVRFSPDGRWIASSSKDNQLLIWDLVAGKLLNTIRLDPAYVTSFEFNPVDFIIGAVTSTRNVRLWDLETMEPLSNTPSDSSPIRTMAFSGDGNSIYTATKDSLKIYSWEPSAKLKHTVEAGWDKVAELRVSSDGSKLTAGSFNSNFVSVWSVDLEKVSNPSPAAGSKRAPQHQQRRSKGVPPETTNNNSNNVRQRIRDIEGVREVDCDYPADSKFDDLSIGGNPMRSEDPRSAKDDDSAPAMQWASDEARDDMAASMSVSFQKKLADIKKLEKAIEDAGNINGSDEKGNDRRNNNNNNEAASPSSIKQLQGLLPPSRYIQSPPPVVSNPGIEGLRSTRATSDSPSSSDRGGGDRKGSPSRLSPTPSDYRMPQPRSNNSSNGNGSGSGNRDGVSSGHNNGNGSRDGGSNIIANIIGNNGIGNRASTPLVGLKGHTPIKSQPRPVSDTRDGRDARERDRGDTRGDRGDMRGDYMSYDDIDGNRGNPLEIRGLNARSNSISASSAAAAVVSAAVAIPVAQAAVADTKFNKDDPNLRAAAKRVAVAAAAGLGSGLGPLGGYTPLSAAAMNRGEEKNLDRGSDRVSERVPERVSERVCERAPERASERVSERAPVREERGSLSSRGEERISPRAEERERVSPRSDERIPARSDERAPRSERSEERIPAERRGSRGSIERLPERGVERGAIEKAPISRVESRVEERIPERRVEDRESRERVSARVDTRIESRVEERVSARSSYKDRNERNERDDDVRAGERERKEDEADLILDRVIRSSGSISASMSLRLSSIRILKRLWIRGDLDDIIEHMESLVQGSVHDISQLVLLADLFSSVELKGNHFTLQSCVGFMNVLDSMVSTSERLGMGVVVSSVLKGFSELLSGFGELIRSVNAMQGGGGGGGGGGGVDLNREERWRKCNICHVIIDKLHGRFHRIKQVHRTDYKLLDILYKLTPVVENILAI